MRASQPAPAPASTAQRAAPHSYSVWYLGLLCVGAIFFQVVAWTVPNLNTSSAGANSPIFDAALIVYLGVIIGILVVDWRHVLTLHGHVNWRTLSPAGRAGIGILYAFLMILIFSLPVLYLAFAVKDTIDARRDAPSTLALRTAELEASLGFVPGEDGVCPHCHRPLQSGAEYCAYCGAALVSRPRGCPTCATVAPADAMFCPHCGASFQA